mgnify:FL=1
MPYITNGKRDYKKEYQAFVLRKQNDEEYAEKHRKDSAARSNKSWHKNKTPERHKQKRLYAKEYSEKYPEKVKLTRKKTNEKRKTDPIRLEKNKIYHRTWTKNKRITDPNAKLLFYTRSRMYQVLRGLKKSAPTLKLLGVPNIEFLWQHLIKQFQPGMTRENYGLWHVDHIIPCASFDFSDPEQQKKCFHYTNLQPLWAIDNMRKSNKNHSRGHYIP